MLYISNCHWAYHSNNIMTWASFQRHKTSQTGEESKLRPDKTLGPKGFFTDRFKFCLSAKETFTVVLVIFDRRGNTWKCRFVHCQVSNSGALKRGNVKDTYHPRIDGLPV